MIGLGLNRTVTRIMPVPNMFVNQALNLCSSMSYFKAQLIYTNFQFSDEGLFFLVSCFLLRKNILSH